MESFGENDQAAMVVGPKGEIEGIWQVLDFYIALLRIYPPSSGLYLVKIQPTRRIDR